MLQELNQAKAALQASQSKEAEASQQYKRLQKEMADQTFMLANAEANAEEAQSMKDAVRAYTAEAVVLSGESPFAIICPAVTQLVIAV